MKSKAYLTAAIVQYEDTPSARVMRWQPFTKEHELPQIEIEFENLKDLKSKFDMYCIDCKPLALAKLDSETNGFKCWTRLARGVRKPRGYDKACETPGQLKYEYEFTVEELANRGK